MVREEEAIRQVAELALESGPGGMYDGAKIHIVHLANAESLRMIEVGGGWGGGAADSGGVFLILRLLSVQQ